MQAPGGCALRARVSTEKGAMQAPGGLRFRARTSNRRACHTGTEEVTDEKERHCLRAGAYDDGDLTVGMFRIEEESGSDGRSDRGRGERNSGCDGAESGRR